MSAKKVNPVDMPAGAAAGAAAGGYFVRWLFDLCDEELLSRLDVCVREVVEAVLASDDARGELVLKLELVKRWERRVEVKPTVSRGVRVEACRRRRMWTDGAGVYAADPAQLGLGL